MRWRFSVPGKSPLDPWSRPRPKDGPPQSETAGSSAMSIPGGAFDVAIVGAGICGLAHALAAARRGKRVIVVDRDAEANGASVRNFGFITVTGQQGGDCWRRARRSRDVWAEISEAAKIPILQRGLLTISRRPEARAVLEQFLGGE